MVFFVKQAHPKIESIYNYLKKETLVNDLISSKILISGEDGALINERIEENHKPEIFKLLPGGKDPKGKPKPYQGDAFIIFSVEIAGDPQSDLSKDSSVWSSWIKYYSSLKSNKGFCYINGDISFLSNQHPSKIRNTGDKAKIISANDTSGFTFHGKFTSIREACTIGFEVSQKAHNALRWLIQKQGFRDGDLSLVAWAVSGQEIPDPFSDTGELFNISTDNSQTSPSIYTAEDIGVTLSKMLAGYSVKLGATDRIIIIGVDSATTGRLAIIYYRELTRSDFLQRIQNWHEQGAWEQKFPKGKHFFGAPSPKDIAEAAYGSRVDDKLKKTTIKRIFPCIIDNNQLPSDLVKATVRQASKNISLISGNGKNVWVLRVHFTNLNTKKEATVWHLNMIEDQGIISTVDCSPWLIALKVLL
jgi:CRISPR-associated protein Csd1